jgi:zinc-ribbon domain
MKRQPPPVCPVCGEEVPRNAPACPECGADEKSGWREDAETYDGLDLPDDFDYDEFTRREFGRSPKPPGISLLWWVTAIVVLALTLLYLFVGR